MGDLDPVSWDDFRAHAHELLDAAVDRLEHAGEGQVWTPVADFLRDRLKDDLPLIGQGAGSVATNLAEMLPYGVGNTHPRFFGWVHGAGSPGGLLAEIAAAAMNVNAGGRDHLAPLVEQQVLRWSAQIMGLPQDSTGLIVSGTSFASLIAMKVARDQTVSTASAQGVPMGQLVGYTSAQAHSCIARAFDMLGLGTENLRMVECNTSLEMDPRALRVAIKRDRDAGKTPFCIIGTAGTVNSGAVDPLAELARVAEDETVWFHVDGAFGAALMLSSEHRSMLKGIEKADSLAFDFHKWIQVNYEAGCLLIRDGDKHRASFSDRPDYLSSSDRGLKGGAFWGVDYGPELSRSFRALKIWAHFIEHGTEMLGITINRNIELARYLQAKIDASPVLEMLAPAPLQICCFRYTQGHNLDGLNEEIVTRLQETGFAVPSTTRIDDALAIRVNITNHRTQESDLDALFDQIESLGAEIQGA